jgi:hypothetical protein
VHDAARLPLELRPATEGDARYLKIARASLVYMQRPCGLHMGVWQTPPAQHGCPDAPQAVHVVVESHAVPAPHQ